jgi:C-terminal processing protease CtpA/Prc
MMCRSVLSWLLIFSGSLLLTGRLPAQEKDSGNTNPPTAEITEEQQKLNLESFDYTWEIVRDQYWDSQLGGVDWQQARDQFRPRVEAAKSQAEARQAIRELLDQMKVSHFGVIPAEAYSRLDESKPAGRHETGMDVRIVDGQVLVTEVRQGSPADKLGVRRGWQVTAIGDTDLVQRYAELSEELKEHPHRRTILADAARGKLLGRPGESLSVVFRDGDEQQRELLIPLQEPRGKLARFGHIPEFRVWIEVRELEGDVGYIRFNAFMDPAFIMPQFTEAMNRFREKKGIVIDVRGNGGGLGEMGTAIMGWLLKGDRQQMGTVLLRDNQLKMFVHPRANPYQGHVVVLIDELSVSAAEFFASGMQDLELARLVGTRTAGAVLGSSIERLPNGDGLQFARANYLSLKTGKTLEGVGVRPDTEVRHQRDALLQGIDRQLQAALEWIRQQSER